MSTENIGEKLRLLRAESKLPLRKVAALIDIDVAILSKMERGERRLTKEVVRKLAKVYKHNLEELMVLYLSERLVYEIGEDDLAIKALHMAEQQVAYINYTKVDKKTIIKTLKDYLKKDNRIKAAWLFGSFARGDENYKSDIDLMLRFDNKKKISLFDFADIEYKLEQQLQRKIDLVEEGCLLPFALESAQKDLVKIYG